MTFEQFHNGLRLLINIDKHELVEAEVIAAADDGAWMSFRENPWMWFIRADDTRAHRLWGIMEGRTSR